MSLELAITRTSFGGQPLFVGALRDISERKRLEELFQIVAEHSPNSIILKDLQGRFLLVNRRVEEWLGISAQDIIGKTAYEIYPGNYADDAIAEDLVVIRTRQTSSREWEIKFADGNMHVIASTKFPVSDSNGQIIGVGTIGMDVSDLRAAEMQLRQAQKMEALGQLTGGIAHDFNNLLAIMMGNLSLLREDLGPEHASAELVEPAMRAIDQAAALTERMLAFSRQQPLKVQAVDANELLRDMSPLIKRSLIEDIDVVFDLADELNQCRIDPGQLEQAILNLSINARDAMSQGGRLRIGTMDVSFTVEEDGRPVDLLPGDYVLISVSDDGTGIPDHILDRIFDPFFTTKTVGEGTGLGLSMVYGFVKQTNGHIAVTTGPDEGTTFRIYLAAEAGPAPSGDATDGGPVAAANNETILVVEDDGDVRAMVSLILKK